MDAPPSQVKSILLHAYRLPEGCYTLVPTEVWFLIKFTSKGAVHKEIFQNLPRNQIAELYCRDSTCVRIDSFLYVLGGSHKARVSDRVSDSVRRLNLKNPNSGWKPCRPLPYPSRSAKVAVSGNHIYLFPQPNVFELGNPGGFSYDTHKQIDCLNMTPPPGNSPFGRWEIPLCFGFDFDFDFVDRKPGFGVAILSDDREYISVYNRKKNSWKDRKSLEIPELISEARSPPKHAFLNGILYLSYCDDQDVPEYESVTTTLFAYDFKSGKQLLGGNGGVKLPKFKKLGVIVDDSTFLVALADYKLCYLWSLRKGDQAYNWITIYIATVVVDPLTLIVTVVSEDEFDINARTFQSCIPLDSCPDRTCRRKSSRHNLKLKLREESQQDWKLRRCSRRRLGVEEEYDMLINQMSSKDAKREMIARIKKVVRKKRILERKLKALPDSWLTVTRLDGP